MTGGGVCAEGAACTTPGIRCGDASPNFCTECTCGANGHYTCVPCADKPDGGGAGASTGAGGAPVGGTGAGGSTGGGATCAPGATCDPGYKCGNGAAGNCMECTCDATGHLVCMPCPGSGTGGAPGGGAGGASGAGGSSGTAMGPCDVQPMPAPDVGLPCGVMENCPDGKSYRVRCDGTSGACMCFVNGAPQATMPTMSCSAFNPTAALVACGFPDGKI